MKSLYNKKEFGFIQIPIIIAVVGTLAISAGGYYVAKDKKESEGINKVNKVKKEKIDLSEFELEGKKEEKGKTLFEEDEMKNAEDSRVKKERPPLSSFIKNEEVPLVIKRTINYREFVNKIRNKYDAYYDIGDRELANKIISKYPEYYEDKIVFNDANNTEKDNLSGFDEVENKEVESKETSDSQNSEQNDADFRVFISKAQQKIKSLEKDKNNLKELEKVVNEHQNKSINHAEEIMNEWVNFAEKCSKNAPNEHAKDIILIDRDIIVSEKDFLIQDIKSIYEAVDSYFWNSHKEKKKVDVITAQQNDLQNCIEKWRKGENSIACKVENSMMGEGSKYADTITNVSEKLVKADISALEAINDDANDAEERIKEDVENISDIISIMQDFQNEMDKITQEMNEMDNVTQKVNEYEESQSQTNESNLSCEHPSDDYIFVPGEGWEEVKKCDNEEYVKVEEYIPDTSNMTPEQIKDLREAGQVGGDVYIH